MGKIQEILLNRIIDKVNKIETTAKCLNASDIVDNGKTYHLNKFEQNFANYLNSLGIRFYIQRRDFVKSFDFIVPDYKLCIECDGWIHQIEGTGFETVSDKSIPIRYKDCIRGSYLINSDMKLVVVKSVDELEQVIQFGCFELSKQEFQEKCFERLINGIPANIEYSSSELNDSINKFMKYNEFRYGSQIGSKIIEYFVIWPKVFKQLNNIHKEKIVTRLFWQSDFRKYLDFLEIYNELDFCNYYAQPSIIKNMMARYFDKSIKVIHNPFTDNGEVLLSCIGTGRKYNSTIVPLQSLVDIDDFVGNHTIISNMQFDALCGIISTNDDYEQAMKMLHNDNIQQLYFDRLNNTTLTNIDYHA